MLNPILFPSSLAIRAQQKTQCRRIEREIKAPSIERNQEEPQNETYPFIMHQLVHATRPQRGPNHSSYCRTSVDIADELRDSLACVSAFLEQDDLRLLQWKNKKIAKQGTNAGWLFSQDQAGDERMRE